MAVPTRPCGDFKRSYAEDEVIFQTRFQRGAMGVFGLGLLLLPFLIRSDYLLYLLNLVGIAVIGAQGLNILTGFTGQISLGHGAFIGVGAYTAGILSTRLGLPVWLSLPCAGIVAAAVGALFGLPSLRLKGFYLAMATLAAQFILEYVFMEWKGLTGGSQALVVDRPTIMGLHVVSDRQYYFLIMPVAVVATVVARNILRTRLGRAFVAIRDRDISAQLIGVNLFHHKMVAFAISSFYAGITGGLMVYYLTIINPQAFTVLLSIDYLAMIIIGGLGSILGSIFGAVFITLLPEMLKVSIDWASQYVAIEYIFPAIREMIFGLIIVLFLIFEPEGLAKVWWNVKAYWKLWPFPY